MAMRCELPYIAGFVVELRPPKVFHYFQHSGILLIVDYHACIREGKTLVPPPHASVCSPRRGHAMVISDFESSSAAWNSHRIEPKVTIKFRQNLHTTLKRNMPLYSRFNKYNNKNVKYIWHGGDDTLEFGHELGLSR